MTEERDFEQEARKDGWVPQEEWNGPEDKWKPAEQFVIDGESINGILKGKVDRLAQKSEDLEKRVQELLETNKKFGEFTKKAHEREKRERDDLIKKLEDARAQAITDGDGQAAVKAERDINNLREQETRSEPMQLDPVQKAWLDSNPWYESNDKLAAFADGISARIADQGYTGKAYFDELTKRTKEAFPDEFENKNRKRPATVEGDNKQVKDSSKKSFDNLPDDAKAAYATFKRDIPGFTKEQFVEQYDWE